MKKKITKLSFTASLSSDCFGFRVAALLRRLFSEMTIHPLGNMGALVLTLGPCTGVSVRPLQPIASVTPMVSLCL